MKCIACGIDKETLARSHIIPNFIRKRLTGEILNNKVKYTFRWIDRNDLPKQDLPKPNLMCHDCDNKLGAQIENKVADLLMPADITDLSGWENLNIYIDTLDAVEIANLPLNVGKYQYTGEKEEKLNKFCMSIAWRTLHAMAKDGNTLSIDFLESERGKKVDNTVINHLFNNQAPNNLYTATIYYIGHKSAVLISNKNDEYPFAWTTLGNNVNDFGIGVIFGCWVIIWPLHGNFDDFFDNIDRLEKLCFENWLLQVKAVLHASPIRLTKT